MNRDAPVLVYADWSGLNQPTLMGRLFRAIVRGEEVLSFEYETSWLSSAQSFLLDPRLQFVRGRQYADSHNPFGMLLDSAPDRWGRLLIRRKAAMENPGKADMLFDSDYLLAVSDTCRMGALRFKAEPEGAFLANDTRLPVPPIHNLRKLEHASRQFESTNTEDPEHATWLQMLLAPGTSLGGARPKCSVIDPDSQLWIAKFPSRADDYNVGAWEGVVHNLAIRAGIQVAPARIEAFSNMGHTFLTQRFDRKGTTRLHFASAMNLLGYHDGDGAKTGASYLDIVDLIERIGSNVKADLEELWRRIVFNICIHNTDDHLRNHGFLLSARGWTLSPAYDLNPQPWRGGLALNIDEANNECSLDLARDVAKFFRLSSLRQEEIITSVSNAVNNWEETALGMGIKRSEIEIMRIAFNRA